MQTDILVVGNYTHDILVRDSKKSHCLGGPPAYMAPLLKASGVTYRIIAKVGEDFKYLSKLHQPPLVTSQPTACMEHTFRGKNRHSRLIQKGMPILPNDIDVTAKVCIIGAHVMEVPPQTMAYLRKISTFLLADIQGFIRERDEDKNINFNVLQKTPFWSKLNLLDYLKIGEHELEYTSLQKSREKTRLLVTLDSEGCRIVSKKTDRRIATKSQKEIDTTGAGDLFLAGFALGLLKGFSDEKCAGLANACGGLAVQQIGPPVLTSNIVENLIIDLK